MTYYELVVEGPYLLVKGLFDGAALCNKKNNSEIYFSRDENITRETLKEKLKEWLGVAENLVHVIIDESSVKYWEDVILQVKDNLNLSIISNKKIEDAHFNFQMEAYTEKHGKQMKKLIDNLPKTVKYIDKKVKEEKHDVKDSGIYTPEHPYELLIAGELIGDPSEIIKTYREWATNSLITLENIELDFAE